MNRFPYRRPVFSAACVVMVGVSTWAQDAPTVGGRPGRVNVPNVQQPNGTPTGKGAPADDSFLDSTAGDLGITKPSQRYDQRLLGWFDERAKLAQQGFTFEVSLVSDFSKPLLGGVDTGGAAYRQLFDFRTTVDFGELFGIDGGTLSIDFQHQTGQDPADEVGDIQGIGNADADGRTQIAELWYEQIFFENKMRVKVGKIDANTEFAFPEFGGDFVNASYGVSPTIIGVPAYPDAALGFNVHLYPTPWFYVGGGLYDGSGEDGINTGENSPITAFRKPHHYFAVGEAGIRWALGENRQLSGRVAGGVWFHSGDFARFNGSTAGGTTGFYAIAEQTLWHERYYDRGDSRGIAAFAQYGWADADVSEISQHLGVGLTWTGLIPKTEPEVMGIGVSAVQLSDQAGFDKDYEINVEAFYGWVVRPYLLIKPDLQYIVNPSGGNDAHDALVASVRIELTL